MTGWHTAPMLALDCETTGVDPHADRIVQIALCRVAPGEGTVAHLWLLDPGVDIPEQASRIHGISTDRCRNEGEKPPDVLGRVADTITEHLQAGLPIVAFNAAYDVTLLESELARHGLPTVTERLGRDIAPVIDPLVIDKHLSYRKGSRKLADQCAHYGVRLDGAHDAGYDAMAAARLAWRIAQRHDRIAETPLLTLHGEQQAWAAAQANSLRAYFDKSGKAHDGVDGTWPIRARTAVPA